MTVVSVVSWGACGLWWLNREALGMTGYILLGAALLGLLLTEGDSHVPQGDYIVTEPRQDKLSLHLMQRRSECYEMTGLF